MRLTPLRTAGFALAVALSAACGDDGITLPPTNGLPQTPSRPTLDATYRPSGYAAAGDAFVHLFEWRWDDIANECETVLGPAGFRAVQVSPPQEHAVIGGSPWWQRYQPVSYILEGRSGDRAAFQDMVQRCAAAGVDIYVDAVINHMTAGDGTGSAGTVYTKYSYPGLYDQTDFHPPCGVDNYQNEANVQDCELLGLSDLDTGQADVRGHLADYLIDLVRVGVRGFRIDAAKHMQPVELDSIIGAVNATAAADGLPLPHLFSEVIDYGGEAVQVRDYYGLGYASGGASDITEFRFRSARDYFTGANGQSLSDLSGFNPTGGGRMPSDKAVVFVENHDTQRDGGGLTWRSGSSYRLAQVWLLAQPYGYPKVMSSYDFAFRDQGPPSDAGGNTNNVACPVTWDAVSTNGWVCEHRDPAILGMVGFRTVTAGETVGGWWDNAGDAVAFSRGDRGFVALNLEGAPVPVDAATDLPAGTYCDVLTGGLVGGSCAGTEIVVAADGSVQFDLAAESAVAIHVEARL